MLLLCHEMLEIIHVALIEKCGVCRAFTYSAYKSYGFISDKNCDIMIMIRKQNMLHKSLEKSNLWHKIQRTQFSRAKLSACSGMCVLKKPLLKSGMKLDFRSIAIFARYSRKQQAFHRAPIGKIIRKQW